MRFFIRKRKTAPTVIIVALIDILIVLLIFLLVTTTFKQQPALRLALPESSQALKTGANEAAPAVISVDSQDNVRFGPDAMPITVDRLRSELIARVKQDPQFKLALNADKKASFGQIIRVMDAAKAANVKIVTAFAREAAK